MGQAPRPHTLLGTHAGRILYPGSTTAPPWVVSLTRIAGAAWQGKRFVENRDGEVVGVNLLFGTTYGLQSMPMRPVLGSAVHSDQPVLKLYYDLEYNPEAVHAVFDELVRLPNGFLLGRAYWRRAQGPPVFWMWFVLAPARSGGVDGHE